MDDFLIPKKPREKNPEYVKFIRSLPCLACKKPGCDPHHIKSRGAGGGDSANLVPLCRVHHTMIHTYGRRTFEKKFHISLLVMAVNLWNVWKK